MRERPDLVARVTDPKTVDTGADVRKPGDPSWAEPVVQRTSFAVRTTPDVAAGETLTVEQAQRLGLQYSPVLAQARAAVDAAKANVEVAESGFLPTVQGNYAFQAFNSQTGFTGIPVGGNSPSSRRAASGRGRRTSTSPRCS